ncbi:MAG: hypothetical protein JRG94_15480 [Deltaproteobacteria bacterium]|nr:hypothetical protein [Deltaproteobacteria bacterium]
MVIDGPVEGVFRVPPYARCCVSKAGIDFAPIGALFSRSREARSDVNGEEARSQLLGSLRAAVATASADSSRVGVLLSGGLDSSIVYQLCRSFAVERDLPAPVPIFLSYPSSALAYERSFVDALIGDARQRIVVDAEAALTWREAPPWAYPEPHRDVILSSVWRRILSRARACGVDRILSGFGGDQLFLSQEDAPLHLAHVRDPLHAAEILYQWSIVCEQSVVATGTKFLGRSLLGMPVLKGRFRRRALGRLVPQDRRMRSWLESVAFHAVCVSAAVSGCRRESAPLLRNEHPISLHGRACSRCRTWHRTHGVLRFDP